MATNALKARQDLVTPDHESLRSSLLDQLMAIHQSYEGGSGVAAQEWERFRNAVEEAARPYKSS